MSRETRRRHKQCKRIYMGKDGISLYKRMMSIFTSKNKSASGEPIRCSIYDSREMLAKVYNIPIPQHITSGHDNAGIEPKFTTSKHQDVPSEQCDISVKRQPHAMGDVVNVFVTCSKNCKQVDASVDVSHGQITGEHQVMSILPVVHDSGNQENVARATVYQTCELQEGNTSETACIDDEYVPTVTHVTRSVEHDKIVLSFNISQDTALDLGVDGE